MSTKLEKISSPSCGDTPYLIVDQNCRAHEIGIWKARLIRWLSLEWWFGKVFPMNKAGYFLLNEKIEGIYKASLVGNVRKQECMYNNLIDLSKKLHNLLKNRPDASLTAVLTLVNALAITLLLRHPSLGGKGEDSRKWCAEYGSIRAEQLIDDCQGNPLVAGKIWGVAEELHETFPQQEKIVLASFFSRLKDHFKKSRNFLSRKQGEEIESHSSALKRIESVEASYHSKLNKTTLMNQIINSFQTFRAQNAKATPAEIAQWFKLQLETISQHCPLEPTTPARHLILHMSSRLSSWKMKETFRAYGVFLAQECNEHISDTFENAASQLRALFLGDEFLLVMEGMIDRKGKEYCKAIASTIEVQTLDSALSMYVYRAGRDFVGVSNVLIRGVIKELVMRPEFTLTPVFFRQIVAVFRELYEGNNNFSVLEPLLGSCISVHKQGSPQALAALEKQKLIKAPSMLNLMEQQTDPESSVLKTLLAIEQEVVSQMVLIPSFSSYYGSMLGQRIKEAARTTRNNYTAKIHAESKKYEKFLKEKFPDSKEPIWNALKRALQNDPLVQLEKLAEDLQSWKKDSFAPDMRNIAKEIKDFCPALENIAEKAIGNFITSCLDDKKNSPKRPSLVFLYQSLPQFKNSLKAFKEALGLQSESDMFFLKCLNENTRAGEFLDWIQAGAGYAKEDYKESFRISTHISRLSDLDEKGDSEKERELISTWHPYFPDLLAVEQSIVRSGLPSVSINNIPMSPSTYSCRLVKSCAVAQALLETVPVALRNKKHKTAIGKVLTFASIDYNPGALIPPELATLLVEMAITRDPLWFLRTTAPLPNEIEYSFSYSHEVFAVERTFQYSFLNEGENQKIWRVHTKLEIGTSSQEEMDVTFTSNGGAK